MKARAEMEMGRQLLEMRMQMALNLKEIKAEAHGRTRMEALQRWLKLRVASAGPALDTKVITQLLRKLQDVASSHRLRTSSQVLRTRQSGRIDGPQHGKVAIRVHLPGVVTRRMATGPLL